MAKLKISALQMNIAFERPDVNCKTLEIAAEDARINGADVLITPEAFSAGFTMNAHGAVADEAATLLKIRHIARQTGMHIIAGVHRMLPSGQPGNVAVVINRKGDLIHQYVKTHAFSPLNEHLHYSEGDGTEPFEIDGVRMALGICYDIRFPELFRPVASAVDALVVIAAWPMARQSHWDILLRARAIENQAYVVGVNRFGTMGDIIYDGGSAFIAPDGAVMSRLAGNEGQLMDSIDSEKVGAIRRAFPFLADGDRIR